MTVKHLLIASSITGLTLMASAPAAFAYDFAESCAPTTAHASEQGIPDALVILDRSGSMGSSGGSDAAGNNQSKLTLAKNSITELVQASHNSGPCTATDKSGCDDVRIGLGWFSSSSGVDVLPAEDTRDAIISTVNAYGTNGATATGQAARRIYESNELRNAERIGIGIFITDGGPWVGSATNNRNTVEQTLHYLCEARNTHSILTFMVGFGTGTDPRMNALFASAGATGQCCVGNPSTGAACTYQPNEMIDPCLLPRRNATQLNATSASYPLIVGGSLNQLNPLVQCKGARQANNAQALKDELLGLLNRLACTFPLDVPTDYLRYPGADEDPDATRVEFDHAILGSNIRISAVDPGNPNKFRDYLVTQRGVAPAVADQYIGEGWTFGDAFRRTVTLTSKLCEEVRSDNVEITETQVACLCENTGLDCDVLCTDSDDDGYDDNTGSACQNDGAGENVQSGRCREGIVECIVGVEYCAPRFSMQPDICNGVDDDCDGNIDNSSRANPTYTSSDPDDSIGIDAFEWNGNTSQLESWNLSSALFCGFQDFSCSCGTSGSHDIGYEVTPGNPDPEHEWDQFLHATSDQRDKCSCSAGLAPTETLDTPSQAPEEGSDAEQDAACNAAPGSPLAPASLLLFLGLFAALFRRKKD